jgi:vacuolar protein sorting-associated protein IST1
MESSTCDPGLEEAVKSLIYAAPRTDVKELQQVRLLLVEKFGKEFALEAVENSDGKVSEKVLKKLAVTPPAQELVNGYLEEIARTYGVDWPKKPKDELGAPPEYDDDDENPSGGQAQKNLEEPILTEGAAADRESEEREALSKATPPRSFGPTSPLRVNPPSPSTDNLHPRVKGTLDLKPTKKMQDANTGKGTQSKGPVGGTIPDVDELAKRFAALKK